MSSSTDDSLLREALPSTSSSEMQNNVFLVDWADEAEEKYADIMKKVQPLCKRQLVVKLERLTVTSSSYSEQSSSVGAVKRYFYPIITSKCTIIHTIKWNINSIITNYLGNVKQ